MHSGLHHLHARRRLAQHVHANPTYWKQTIDYVMYVVAIGSPLALLPQVIRVFSSHDAGGLSWESFSMFFVINSLWLVYALAHREIPLAIASVCFAILDVALVYGILLYA